MGRNAIVVTCGIEGWTETLDRITLVGYRVLDYLNLSFCAFMSICCWVAEFFVGGGEMAGSRMYVCNGRECPIFFAVE